ncbi:MAG: NAD-dependent epimerase/dehydratase family protein [Candidatus Omnitrophota bacterium]|nr:NAD-dependent epimerase/dehydratase family protein [Candidatus Omnitrophota bacterium]
MPQQSQANQQTLTPEQTYFTGKQILVTGGAGFLGSFLSEDLVACGAKVTIFDRFTHGRSRVRGLESHESVEVIQGNVQNYKELVRAVRGKDLIWHLAGNTDIPAGLRDTSLDLKDGIIATQNVLEAMREAGVMKLAFPSSGAIYGEQTSGLRREDKGPTLPISLYGAGKVSCEAFISAYAHLFDIQAWIFRFGNVISGRITHGAIRDFIRKLRANPKELEVLGDGTQTKSYLLAEECIEGMRYTIAHTNIEDGAGFCHLYNLGAPDETAVLDIAKIVIGEMGLPGCTIKLKGGERGWRGDQAKIALDISKLRAFGWEPKHSSDDAVRISVRRMIEQKGIEDE